MKTVRMPSLPAAEGDSLDEEEPEIEIGSNSPEKLAIAREQLVLKQCKQVCLRRMSEKCET
jgi:hypothetical protein